MAKQHMVETETQQLLRGQQRHTSLIRGTIPLSLIASNTRCDEVVRCALSALCPRENVIERQVLSVLVLATVLTPVTVANVDPCTFHRCFAVIAAYVYVM